MSAPSLWELASVAARTSLLLLAALALTRLLARRSAALRHAVWASALLATLLQLGALSLLPTRVVRVALPGLVERSLARRALAPRVPAPRVAGTRAVASRAPESLWPRAGDPPSSPLSPGAAVVAAWLAGVALLVGRTARGHRLAAALVRRSRPAMAAHIGRIATETARRHGVRRPVAVRTSAELPAPAAVGVLRPVILLPAAAEGWDDATLALVLGHEMAHVARRDALTALLARTACIVHWYNPLAWGAARALATERERACDDRVLADGTPPDRYADLLLAAARWSRRTPAAPAPVLALARESELETRMRAILDEGVPRSSVSGRAVAACMTAAFVVMLGATAIRMEAAVAASPVALVQVPSHEPPRPYVQGPSALQSSGARLPAPEPDRSGDSVAAPRSERLAAPAEAPARLRARLAAARASLRGGPDDALGAQLEQALSRVPDGEADLVRERATWALLVATHARLVEPLVDSRESRDWRVRSYAAWALGLAGAGARRDARLQPRLVAALDHPVWRMRGAAAFALRDVGDAQALPAMRRALQDAAWQVRVPAVEFLAAVGGEGERELLRAMLSDRHIVVRDAASAALASFSRD